MIQDPVPVMVERKTKDRVMSLKYDEKIAARNADEIINMLIDSYEGVKQ